MSIGQDFPASREILFSPHWKPQSHMQTSIKKNSGSSQSIFQLESKTANNFVFWGKAKGVYSQTLLES